MTPEQFSHNANAWVDAFISLIPKMLTLIGGILGIFAYVKSRLNEKRINGHSDTLQTLLLNTPSPTLQAAPSAGPTAEVNINPANDAAPVTTATMPPYGSGSSVMSSSGLTPYNQSQTPPSDQ